MPHLRCNVAGALGAIMFVAVGLAALREADELWDNALFSLTLGLLLIAVPLAALLTGPGRAFWIGFAVFGWGYLSLSLIPATESRLISTNALAYLQQSNIFFVRAYRMRAILALDRMRAHNVSSRALMRVLTPSGSMSARYYDLMKPVEDKRVSSAQLGQATGQASQDVEYVLSWGTRYNKLEQFENIIIRANSEGEILRLKDVAKVEMGSSFYVPRVRGTAENFIHIGHSLFALLAAWLGGVVSRRLRSVSVTPETLREGEQRKRRFSLSSSHDTNLAEDRRDSASSR